MIKDRLVWKKEYMDLAVNEILKDSSTNFESLIKNIQNKNKFKYLLKRIILDNDHVTYVLDNPTINLGVIYGVFKNYNGRVTINNRIYKQRIYNYMSLLIENLVNLGSYNQRSGYIKEDVLLDIKDSYKVFIVHEA